MNGRRWLGGVAFFALIPPPLAAALDADAGDLEGRPLEPNAPAVPVPLRKILRLAFGADEGEGSVGVRIRAAARLRCALRAFSLFSACRERCGEGNCGQSRTCWTGEREE